MSLMASFSAVLFPFFPQNVLDEIWDLMESVSDGFPTYSTITCNTEEPQQTEVTSWNGQ